MMTSSNGNISALLALAAASYYLIQCWCTVYPKKYTHGFVVPCFVVVMQSFIMSSHELFIHIHQGCFAGTGAIVRLSQCQWSKPDGYGKISQCITTTKHSKAKTVCYFLGYTVSLKGPWGIWPRAIPLEVVQKSIPLRSLEFTYLSLQLQAHVTCWNTSNYRLSHIYLSSLWENLGGYSTKYRLNVTHIS